MKNNRILNTAKAVMVALSLGSMTTACSDWDDHYDANTAIAGSANATLWENISANQNLSQFAALAKKAGYDQTLSGSQAYTVWAPLNGTFDYETLDNMPVETLKKQFLQNHISHFNYPASGSIDEKVYTINKKLGTFVGNGDYTMNGVEVANANIASSNGTLHAIDGKLDFNFNIYESINADTYPLDSISAYFAKYDRKMLDVNNSVKGPVVDGEITYLDSVMVDYNSLSNLIGAYISREDSNYTMILPTNDAWVEKKAYVNSLVDYLPAYSYYNELPSKVADNDTTTTLLSVNNTYLNDSISNLLMVAPLAFNNNLYDNVKLNNLQTGQTLQADSLVSTTGFKYYSEDAADLFKNAERVDKSNGAVWITNSLGYKPWDYKRPVKLDGEYLGYEANTFNGTANALQVTSLKKNPEVEGRLSNDAYVEVVPDGPASNPEIDYYLPQVYKGKYVLYICMVPSNINVDTYNPSMLPNRIQVVYGRFKANGKYEERTITGTFTSDPTKIDTLRIGEMEFLNTTAQLDNAMPYIRIKSRANNSYDRTLRIDYIRLVPVELDEYIQQHPGYKWEDEENK